MPLHSRGAMDESEKELQKGLGWLLKHGAAEKGLELLDGGFVRLDLALRRLSGRARSASIEAVKQVVEKSRRQDGTPRFELTTGAEFRTNHLLTPDCPSVSDVSDEDFLIRHTRCESPQQFSRLSRRARQSRFSMLGSSESWSDVENFKTSLGLESPLWYRSDNGEELLAVRAASKAGEKEGKENASILLERVGINKDAVELVRDEGDTVRHALAAGFPTQAIDMHVMFAHAEKAGLRAVGLGPHKKVASHAAYVAIAATAASTEGFIGLSMLEKFVASTRRPADTFPPPQPPKAAHDEASTQQGCSAPSGFGNLSLTH